MIRYPELVVIGQTSGGKTDAILDAAHQYRRRTQKTTIFVNDEMQEIGVYRRLLQVRADVDPSTLNPDTVADKLQHAPLITSSDKLKELLNKLNPGDEPGTEIAIFLDVPEMCVIELNTNLSSKANRFRVGVALRDPIAALVKNYQLRAAAVTNYEMPVIS